MRYEALTRRSSRLFADLRRRPDAGPHRTRLQHGGLSAEPLNKQYVHLTARFVDQIQDLARPGE